jgi:hypothetical protein
MPSRNARKPSSRTHIHVWRRISAEPTPVEEYRHVNASGGMPSRNARKPSPRTHIHVSSSMAEDFSRANSLQYTSKSTHCR